VALDRDLDHQMRVILSGTEECLPEGDLRGKVERAIREDKPLRVKFGVDPTRPDLHLGHAVPLRKLRQFQDLGHTAILLIGDFTARVGDPSARDVTRPQLTAGEVQANAETYTEQAFRILDRDRTVVDYNSRWLAPLTFEELLKLTSYFTVARMLERDDFSRRYSDNVSIGLHELAARELQKSMGQEPQSVLTLPILVGLDGEKKMSKSLGNHVGLTDPPQEMFGKLMSLDDRLMPDYFRLTTALEPEEVEDIIKGLEEGSLHPAEAKRKLAREVVGLYWGREAAEEAEKHFDRVFKDKELPRDIPEVVIPPGELREGRIWLPRLLVLSGLASSTSEGRRLISQGGVKVGERVIEDTEAELRGEELDGLVLQRGKRHFRKLRYGVDA